MKEYSSVSGVAASIPPQEEKTIVETKARTIIGQVFII
jgi:hypothetical protein